MTAPENTETKHNAELMLGQRRWRWPNINPALGKRFLRHARLEKRG